MANKKIDFVIPWVDQDDEVWQKLRSSYQGEVDEDLNSEERYRDYGTLKYLFRSIEQNASWVNQVFLVTNGQVPQWLNLDHPQVKLIRHDQYMPKEALPTFNSNAIEINFNKIPDLSEQFVLFNDDYIINQSVQESDFFIEGMPVDANLYKVVFPMTDFSHLILNNLVLINEWFNKRDLLKNNFSKVFNTKYGLKGNINNFRAFLYSQITAYDDPHVTIPFTKHIFNEVANRAAEKFAETTSHQFRSSGDITQWLIRYYQLQSGNFVPRKYNFGKIVNLENIETIKEIINQPYKIICINDESKNYESDASKLNKILNKKFPTKSKFEK